MTRKIKVSRHGLTRCPACLSHIQLAADARLTTCPFCEASLLATPEPAVGKLGSLIQGALATGRSSLLAASLLGLSVGVGACADEEDPEPSTDTQSADGTSGTSDGTSGTTIEDAADTGAVALYGISPDATTSGTSGAADTSVEDAADTGAVAMYGIAPSDAVTAEDIDTEDTADSGNVALYGIAPFDANP